MRLCFCVRNQIDPKAFYTPLYKGANECVCERGSACPHHCSSSKMEHHSGVISVVFSVQVVKDTVLTVLVQRIGFADRKVYNKTFVRTARNEKYRIYTRKKKHPQ